MKSKERMDVVAALRRHLAASVIPWDEVLDCHGCYSFTAGPAYRDAEAQFRWGQAIGLRSGRFAVELMDVRRGRSIDRDPARLHGLRNFASQLRRAASHFQR